jgi:hypothetical protein
VLVGVLARILPALAVGGLGAAIAAALVIAWPLIVWTGILVTLGLAIRKVFVGALCSFETTSEDTGNVNLALTEPTRQGGRVAGLVKRATKVHTTGQEVDIASAEDRAKHSSAATADTAFVVVLASVILALISFSAWKERMTYELLVVAYPDLLPSLVQHQGIGFAKVHSAHNRSLVVGEEGMHYLAAVHLSRTDSCRNAPDILFNCFYDPVNGYVTALEELVG